MNFISAKSSDFAQKKKECPKAESMEALSFGNVP